MYRKSIKLLSAALLVLSSAAQAEWTLDGSGSSFYYVTTKAAAISEVNSFGGLSGSISDKGNATLVIDLATVNTAIEIRDQRMRDLVFKVGEFPSATVSVTVDSAALDTMEAGVPVTGSYTATVALHGMTQEIPAELQIVKLNANTVQVQLARPLLVAAASFGLEGGVEELRTVAALPSITPTVVVDFALLYRKQ